MADGDPATRAARLRGRLAARFAPIELEVEDQSHFHAGHAGAEGGHGHYRIRIVAEAFRGLPAVARHRLVYGAVGDMLQTDIHALAVEALAPAEQPDGRNGSAAPKPLAHR